MPKIVVIDKVDHDKKFFETQFESLKEDIQAVRSTDPHKILPVFTLPESVTYNVHSTETQINDALTPLLEQLDDPAYHKTVGFDAEWTFNADTHQLRSSLHSCPWSGDHRPNSNLSTARYISTTISANLKIPSDRAANMYDTVRLFEIIATAKFFAH
ncbi:hypothetical protein EC973_003952 [Apophysomyces ossiformis]|uniref:Uncharacterized protein n=1 Tax=Apophysomyces ossiformis TaxID=679940 RepID=A0A8H7BL42_9FUNG|nr:hypothetical protein EC973_003952 [Apophysomyces ossiformis]